MAGESQHNTEPLFELVYEGPCDDAPRTLQLIKGVFVADLNFPIPEVQRILEHAPATIASGSSESELKEQFSKLKSAGARVLIVKRGADGESEEPGDLLQRLLSEAEQNVSDDEEEDSAPPQTEEADISFEFDLDAESHTATRPKQPAGGKVYALDLDESENPDELLAELTGKVEPVLDLTSPAPEAPKAKETIPEPAPQKPDNTSGGLTLLGEEELREFHKARGGALEESHEAHKSYEEENPFENLEDSLKEALHSDARENQKQAETAASNEAKEVALVLSEVSLDLAAEESESKKPAASPASAPPTPSAAKPKGIIPAPSTMEFAFDVAEEEPAVAAAPPPPPSQKPPAPSAPAPSDLSFEAEEPEAAAAVSAPAAHQAAPQATSQAAPATASTRPGATAQNAPQASAAEAEDAATIARPATSNPARKKKSFQRSALEFGLPILVGTLVLAAANWAYFGGAPAPTQSSGLLVKASDLEASSSASTKSAAPAPIRKWLVTETYPDRRVEARIQEVLDKKVLGQITLTSPPQRSRTNEEIAQNVKLPPWLKRFEVSNLVMKPNVDNARLFSIEGPAFFYIEYDGKSQRYVGRINATVNQSADAQVFSLTYQAQLGVFNQSAESTFAVARSEDGSFSAFVSGDLELK